ncbi:DUF2017 family protein [Arthrobacter sp. JZ12]|uniref:DUF2017 domain-containing protein n=1 Tax=Arthrobacter sp. JZ12 TaxID=2654190 RepID=UPI002B473EF0|nr:DUF2017 domain-containing protein [Arthrobacter sp. JZ12]WRH25228.1 DUF2017 family protein [Arthrobacter sp. JZ12]
MARAFRTTRRGITGDFESGELKLLRRLFADVVQLLEPEKRKDEDPLAAMVGIDPEAERPADSAVARLLPDAVRNDDDGALEFRRLTERSLREEKVGALRAAALLMEKPQVVLTPEQAQLLAKALTDVRLVLADRLDIQTDEDAARLHDIADLEDAEDLESYLALVYNFVTWVQEGLVQALLSSAGHPSGER